MENKKLQKLAKEAFIFGKDLGIIQKTSFEEFLGKIDEDLIGTTVKQELKRIPGTKKRMKQLGFNQKVINFTIWLKEHTKEGVLGKTLLDIARENNLLFEVTDSWPELPKTIVKKLKDFLPKDMDIKDVESVKSSEGRGWHRIVIMSVNGEEVKIKVHALLPYKLVDYFNSMLREELKDKKFVQIRDAAGNGFLLINKNMSDKEKNPFIPFYSGSHLETLGKKLKK